MLPHALNAALVALALGCALACIAATNAGSLRGVYWTKPLPMLCALALAAQPAVGTSETYRWLVLAGLAFSLAGDVFLMLPSDRFLAGLASFLVAHLLYVAAFVADSGLHWSPWLALPMATFVIAAYSVLAPGLGRMAPAVALYVTAIGLMGWQAGERWLAEGQLSTLLACIGAALFMFSDAALGFDRFRQPLGRARGWAVLGSYFPAQILIALSVGVGEGVIDWAIR